MVKRVRRLLKSLFVLLLFFKLNACAAQEAAQEAADKVSPDFYHGLLYRAGLRGTAENAAETDEAANRNAAALLFEKALDSPNVHIRQAAAEELFGLLYEGVAIADTVLNRARREAAGAWALAFEVLDADPAELREKARAFILNSGDPGGTMTSSLSRLPEEAIAYVLRECLKRDANLFSPAESAAIGGHIAASRSRFSEALNLFRTVMAEEPQLFFQYPGLLNDLGRSFQYAAVGTEGMDIFMEWERTRAGEAAPGAVPLIRFRLLFFAARIARQRGLLDQGIELFARARAHAPDAEQADACIWYILDSSLNRGSAAAIRQLAAFRSQWHNDAYFFDVLDKLSRELVLRRQWKDLIYVFSLIQDRPGGALTAKYAYIIGRALEEGYLSPEEISLAAGAIGAVENAGTNKDVSRAYLRTAYNAGNASFYYYSQSAATLGEPFLELPEPPVKNQPATPGVPAKDGPHSAAMEFLTGFFTNGAAVCAPRYIRALEQELSADHLRPVAAALEAAELYAESIRLVSVYTAREGYTADKQDLELYYPRPFRELVEQYAEATGLAPELLFGLIRTESAFQSGIVSRAGAVGLTQLMPATAEEMAARIRRQGGPDYTQPDSKGATGPDLRDPAANIHIGAAYLGYLRERMEDTLLALLAYNGGMNRVRRWRAADSRSGSLPIDLFLETIEYPETREYGRRVLAASAVYGELYYIE